MRFRFGLIITVIGLGSLTMLYSLQGSTASAPNATGIDGSESNSYRLCQVHILCRHGARTPIHVIPGIEEVPYNKSVLLSPLDHTHVHYTLKEESGKHLEHPGETEKAYLKKVLKGGSEAGQLTTVGQQQAYDFGSFLRKKFIESNEKFISHKYSREDVFLRSTNVKRTVETVRCIMAGLYGKNEMTEPILIHTVNDKDEIFYPNPHCEIIRFLAHRDWMRFESPTSQMIKDQLMLEELLAIDKTVHKLDYVHLRDDIACRMVHDLPTPDILMPHYDRIDKHAVRLFVYQCTGYSGDDSELMLKLIAGPMLRKFRDKMDERVRGSKTPKLFIYGAHDSSILPVLVALGGFDNQWPPFLANLTFELYERRTSDKSKGSNSFFVKVSYCNKPIIVPGCLSEMCPYDMFWKSLSEYEVPSASLPSTCSDQAKHRELTDAYKRQLKEEEESDSEMPAGM